MRYEIPEPLKATYRQMTIDTPATLDADGFDCDDPTEADAIMTLVARDAIADVEDSDELPDADLRALFSILYGRQPDATDLSDGLWSHICAAV